MCKYIFNAIISITLQMCTGHELKGVMAYYNCHIPSLHTPMTAIIDFRGTQCNFATYFH